MSQVIVKDFLTCIPFESEMLTLIRDFDWSKTSLGPIEDWPHSLKNAVTLMLSSGQPTHLAWGEDFIQLYNDAYRPLLGHKGRHPEALGKSARETFPEAWHEILPLWESVISKGKYFNGENMKFLLRRNGIFEECFFIFSVAPLRDDNFEIKGVYITCHETSDKVRKELKLGQEMMRFQHQIFEYQQNLSARDEFISIASHDLKSPLTALKLQTQTQKQLLLKQDPRGFDKDRIKLFSESVDDQVGRLNKMVDDMLEIGRIRRGAVSLNKENVELGRLVRDSIESVRTCFTIRNFPIVETQGLIKGVWDSEKLKQVVSNLLINSVKFAESSPISVKVTREGLYASLVIKDEGPGIPAQYLDKIFDRYERVAPKNQQENGHGLFLTKKIVELHNGKIWVESAQGKGTSFSVLLPLQDQY
jgi:signal transduction histidine kinase